MMQRGRLPKRSSTRKRAVVRRIQQKSKVEPKPKVKVLFLCTLGEQASLNSQIGFANVLNGRKMRDNFELSHAGVNNLPPKTTLLQLISQHDFIVTCNDHAKFRVSQLGAVGRQVFNMKEKRFYPPQLKTFLEKMLNAKKQ